MKARLLLALSAAAALAAVILAPAAGATAAVQPCSSSGLVIWAGEEPGGGTAGSVFYRVQFTNLSARTCTLTGFPRVNAVDLHGKRIGAPAAHGPANKVATVKLAPGDSAFARLQIVDALNFPKGRCDSTFAAGLRITVPGGSGAKIAPLAFETCTKPSTKTLSIGAVTGSLGPS